MLRNLLQSIVKALHRPVRIEPMAVFRIAFGAMMLFSTLRFIFLGWIDDHYIQPLIHFHYYGFSWVEPLAPWAMYVLHVIMVVASICIILGYYYRLSTILFFLCFTYCELIDLTYYLNHYYFVSIVSGLIIFLPLHRFFSLDVYFGRVVSYHFVPAWTKYAVILQMSLVYIFAGLAKINYDWLILALPLKIWLPAHYDLPLIGFLFEYKITPYVFSWAGMVYDISIPFLLFFRITRPWAYLSVLVFHGLTGMLFQIGVFPLVMMSGTLLFFSDTFHQCIVEGLRKALFFVRKSSKEVLCTGVYHYPVRWHKVLLSMVCLHFIIQVLFPFRYLLYPGNLFWTEEGYRYSWRVLLMEKAGTATFYVKDAITGKEGAVINSDFLNLHQEKQMAMQPDMILQYAHWLADYYKTKGIAHPQVRAEVYVTLNARPSKLLIDPHRNLVPLKDGWAHKTWIINDEE
jgi:hypothetical protein